MSSGTTTLVPSSSAVGTYREFITDFSASGGERYYASFADDPLAHNFLYDAEVYFDGDSSTIANIEMDLNQVTSNGQTVIYGFQCDGYSGTWDYTKNSGSPAEYVDSWVHSSSSCNPRNWTTGVWHRIQISYSGDDFGNVTYKSVVFDGQKSEINETVSSSFVLGWSASLVTNFQIDGLGSGTNTVYLNKLSVSMW